MGRPSSRLKLQDLEPCEVADDILRLAAAHLTNQAMAIGYDVVNVNTDGFWVACAELCRYAKTGELPAPGKQPGSSHLYHAFGASRPTAWPGIAVLIDDAANARWHIYAGDRVSAKDLALLAGLDERHVRLLARHGHLTLGKTGVAAKEAARWLASRSVPGFITYENPRTP